jgi:hypothetical protein
MDCNIAEAVTTGLCSFFHVTVLFSFLNLTRQNEILVNINSIHSPIRVQNDNLAIPPHRLGRLGRRECTGMGLAGLLDQLFFLPSSRSPELTVKTISGKSRCPTRAPHDIDCTLFTSSEIRFLHGHEIVCEGHGCTMHPGNLYFVSSSISIVI